MSLTKVSYSMIDGTPVNVVDFGADPTGVADSTAAIQAAFDKVYTSTISSYAELRVGQLNAVAIYFPPGEYLVTQPLDLGEAGKYMYCVTLKMDGASIKSTYSGASPALHIHTPKNCNFYGLDVYSENVTAIKISNSLNCAYYNTKAGAGAGALAAIHLDGFQFNNTWNHTLFEQNVGIASADWCWYWECNTSIAPLNIVGGPINIFNGFYMANAINSMFWIGGSEITINTLEHEGFATALAPGVAQFYGINNLSITNAYQEAFPNPANSLYFDACTNVKLTNIQTGSFYHYTKFKNCSRVSIENMEPGAIKYEGTNRDFIVENYQPRGNSSLECFQEDSSGIFQNFQAKNITVRNTLNLATIAQIPLISTGPLGQSENWVLNPRALDASGNVTTLYCTCVNDPSFQEASPLGFIESTVEIDAITNFPQLQLNFDTTKINNAKTSKAVVVTAWRKTPRSGFTAVANAGVYDGVTPIYGQFYGMAAFTIGAWVITYTMVDVDSANTKVNLVWNYNTIDAIGTKFSFGGALMYAGSEFAYPLLY